MLRSSISQKTLYDDLSSLNSPVNSGDFDLALIKPLLDAALTDNLDDAAIWEEAHATVTKFILPPRLIPTPAPQTPLHHTTSSIVNSSELREQVDEVLKREVGTLYVGLPVYDTFFGCVVNLELASKAIFAKFTTGDEPLFEKPIGVRKTGWRGWPQDANQYAVLNWFKEFTEKLVAFAEEYEPGRIHQRGLLGQPDTWMQGSIVSRKLDIGFTAHPEPEKGPRCDWSQVLVPGKLKSNPYEDNKAKTNTDLATYAREILTAQDKRRFVLGFTLCGSLMRIWEFDRLGGIASEAFDINEDGLRFVSVILGFLWMSGEELGFDPTITKEGDRWFITINKDGQKERLVIDELVKRAHCITGRATVCWKAHREPRGEGEPCRPLVIKDSWQYMKRLEEGELLQKASDKGVANVARYYHHETVIVGKKVDEIQGNVRRGLDVMKATNYRPEQSVGSSGTNAVGASSGDQGSSNAGTKRPASSTDAIPPPSKRSCLTSLAEVCSNELPNRVHRRVILRDYGKAIYKASSRSALLAALEGCIEGHKALHKGGILHRDISINNLMINEDPSSSSWPSFLIDLDLAIDEGRGNISGVHERTGTRAFMEIGVLLDEQHSFRHDLESFFWVLFWICIHYKGPGLGISKKEKTFKQYDKWNFMPAGELATAKMGTACSASGFSLATAKFTEYYKPLIPWMEELRQVVFPHGEWQETEDEGLYSKMKGILRAAQGGMELLGR